jgi:histidyl-tRNA synthetase
MDYECRSTKAQMRTANKLNSRFTIVIGPDELEKGVIKLKDMQTGDEKLAEDANEIVQLVQRNE